MTRPIRAFIWTGILLIAGLFAACEWFDYPLDKYFDDALGTVKIKRVITEEGKIAIGTDGYVCLDTTVTSFNILLDNGQDYDLDIEQRFTQTAWGGYS
jgi:hypothetical protein